MSLRVESTSRIYRTLMNLRKISSLITLIIPTLPLFLLDYY